MDSLIGIHSLDLLIIAWYAARKIFFPDYQSRILNGLRLLKLDKTTDPIWYTLFFYKKPRDPFRFSPQSFLKKWSVELSKFLMSFLIPYLALQGNNGENHEYGIVLTLEEIWNLL